MQSPPYLRGGPLPGTRCLRRVDSRTCGWDWVLKIFDVDLQDRILDSRLDFWTSRLDFFGFSGLPGSILEYFFWLKSVSK